MARIGISKPASNRSTPTAGWCSLTRFTLTRKAGFAAGTKPTRQCRCLAGWPAGCSRSQSTQVYLNGDVFEDGGVAVSVGGGVKLAGVISQGCTPIGESWTLTRVEKNLIHQIANRPAYAVLARNVSKAHARRTKEGAGQPAHRPGRERIPRGFSPRRFSGAQSHRRRPEFRRAGRRRAAAGGADDAIPAARRGGGDRGHDRTARPRPGAVWRRDDLRRLPLLLQRSRTGPLRRAGPRRRDWCKSISARSGLPVSLATAKSGRSAERIICTVSRPRWRCL